MTEAPWSLRFANLLSTKKQHGFVVAELAKLKDLDSWLSVIHCPNHMDGAVAGFLSKALLPRGVQVHATATLPKPKTLSSR